MRKNPEYVARRINIEHVPHVEADIRHAHLMAIEVILSLTRGI